MWGTQARERLTRNVCGTLARGSGRVLVGACRAQHPQPVEELVSFVQIASTSKANSLTDTTSLGTRVPICELDQWIFAGAPVRKLSAREALHNNSLDDDCLLSRLHIDLMTSWHVSNISAKDCEKLTFPHQRVPDLDNACNELRLLLTPQFHACVVCERRHGTEDQHGSRIVPLAGVG